MEYTGLAETEIGNLSETGYYQNARSEVVRFLPDKYSKVLEIGCGAGYFRENLNSSCEYWGVEPVDAVASHARGRLSKVLIGTFEDVYRDIPDNYFDLVICNDVIEHMPSHDDFLCAIKSKMKKDSCLVGSLPNIRFIGNLYELLVKKEWIYRNEGILDKTHLRFFTYRSIERTFREHGYDIEVIGGINNILRPPDSFKRGLLNILIFTLLIGSLGYYSDTLYHQFAFRIKYPGNHL